MYTIPPIAVFGLFIPLVGIARALAIKPQIVLLDEPLGSLDNITRRKLQTELKQIHANTGITIIMVTHDLSEAF